MNPATLPEITKIQLQQSVETYRVQLSLLVQICTVFVVADATTVGYALQQRVAGIFWIGLIFPLTMFLIVQVVFRLSLPVLATAISIETKYKDADVVGLMTTFVAVGMSRTFLEQLRAASLLESEQARTKALSGIKKPPSFSGGRSIRWILLLIIVGQAVTPILLWRFAGWVLLGK